MSSVILLSLIQHAPETQHDGSNVLGFYPARLKLHDKDHLVRATELSTDSLMHHIWASCTMPGETSSEIETYEHIRSASISTQG